MPGDKKSVDMHVHVGIIGKPGGETGFMSEAMKKSLVFKIFLLYLRIPEHEASDARLRSTALELIRTSEVDRVVCLALDAVYDQQGKRDLAATTMYVPNDYVLGLQRDLPGRILYGASVHPYDPTFKSRVSQAVADGAALLKWLPSAQQINLADPRVGDAIAFLATAGKDRMPLPLLVHIGTEGAIMSTNPATMSYDFLTWGFWDKFWNGLRPKAKKWAVPDLASVHENLRRGLEAGSCIIMAHCGLPYFAPRFIGKRGEHNDIEAIAEFLTRYPGKNGTIRGKVFADVSAILTPFRQSYFSRIRELPPGSLLTGSDCPVPIFELSANLDENMRDLKSVLEGKLDSLIIPQGNLLDVNMRELEKAFPGHSMFGNAAQIPNWT
jgi:predicted TIM-barrel fold metal-dependent hydrolase